MGALGSIPVATSNAEQLRAWDGDEGAYWAAHADYFDRSVAAHHQRLLAAASIGTTDRVLDLGCGTGQTTCDAARAATRGTALGIDLSSLMLAHARHRATEQGLANVAFVQADAQVHDFGSAAFDLAISRTGAMFFGDPAAAFGNVAGATAPGGRLVILTWQDPAANEWIRELSGALAAGRDRPVPPPGAPGPFALADPDRVRSVLSSAGYRKVDVTGFEAPMWFGTDADDAHRFVLGLLGWMLEGLDDEGRRRAVEALHATLRAHATADGVQFASAAWVISATRG